MAISKQIPITYVSIRVAAILLLLSVSAHAQELFINTEPASNIPYKTLGIRIFSHSYKEVNNQHRNLAALRLMYGVTPKLSVYVTASASNHHSKDLPPSFPDHNTPQIGVQLPYRFNGVTAYAKYRFLSHDGTKKHFRMAVYGEWSQLNVAHDEAEPTLLDDTKGAGAGLITTYLHHKMAVSFTTGVILPMKYTGVVPDFIPGLPSIPATVKYGKAAIFDLSFGYLLFPRTYKSYNQTNINLYLEFLGKYYGGAQVFFDNISQPGTAYEITGAGLGALSSNYYVEVHPGIQAIIKSNLRIEASVGFPAINKSYTRFYPEFRIGIQRYFYL